MTFHCQQVHLTVPTRKLAIIGKSEIEYCDGEKYSLQEYLFKNERNRSTKFSPIQVEINTV